MKVKKDLLSLYDLNKKEIEAFLTRALELKKKQKQGELYHPLRGKTLGMIFEKPSTRTRVSFEVGMFQLGGLAIYMRWTDTQLGRGESIADTARILSRYIDGIMIRTFAQATLEELARNATVPVINGLTDLCHPCQILADLFTIREKRKTLKGSRWSISATATISPIPGSMPPSGCSLTLRLPARKHMSRFRCSGTAQREAASNITLLHDPLRR